MAGERTVKIKFTGDAKGVDRAARQAESRLSRFGNGITNALQNATDKLPGVLSGAIGALPPQGQALALVIVGGLGAALFPLIGAALSAALTLALGGGVLALGIKAAIDNPKVAKAFDGLKKKAAKIFDEFGKPFEGPLIRATKTFGGVLDDLRPAIDRLGKMIAPVIDKLAPALGDFFRAVMPGIENAVKGSIPLFETLAEHLPKIGAAIGLFFTKISENGDDANQFFGDLLDLIENLIIGLGVVIGKLASWYSNVRDFLGQAKQRFLEFRVYAINQLGDLLDAAAEALSWIPGIGPKLKAAQQEFTRFRINANNELQKIKDRNVRINIYSNIGSVAANVASTLDRLAGRRASGGPVSAGRSYLVGERGPEILTMAGNGHVSPNREIGGPSVLQLAIDLGHGIQQVIDINLREHDRRLKRRTVAAGGRA